VNNLYSIQDKILQYLFLGYAINESTAKYMTQNPLKINEKIDPDLDQLTLIFESVFDDIKSYLKPESNVVIPISGGWDSRIILGESLKHFPKKKIKTYSFGVPGQLDFDIGRLISKKLGLNHESVDLTKVPITWVKLLESVSISPWTGVPDSFYNQYALNKIASENDIMLSGYIGGPLTGGHQFSENNKATILQEFLEYQKRIKSIYILPTSIEPIELLPNLKAVANIDYGLQLDLYIRQLNYTKRIVGVKNEWTGWDMDLGSFFGTKIIAPFAHPVWVEYWASIPKKYKVSQNLYLKMMHHNYPKLAKMPSKYSLGVNPNSSISLNIKRVEYKVKRELYRIGPTLFNKPNAMHNYLDFAEAFRTREDYKEVLQKAFEILKENKLVDWLNFNYLYNSHQKRREDYSDCFVVLIGLALNVINEKEKLSN